jgi:hypothetical protein
MAAGLHGLYNGFAVDINRQDRGGQTNAPSAGQQDGQTVKRIDRQAGQAARSV